MTIFSHKCNACNHGIDINALPRGYKGGCPYCHSKNLSILPKPAPLPPEVMQQIAAEPELVIEQEQVPPVDMAPREQTGGV